MVLVVLLDSFLVPQSEHFSVTRRHIGHSGIDRHLLFPRIKCTVDLLVFLHDEVLAEFTIHFRLLDLHFGNSYLIVLLNSFFPCGDQRVKSLVGLGTFQVIEALGVLRSIEA